MRYVSTRGRAPELGFAEVLLTGLATDGGLYVPGSWPALEPVPPGLSYAELAVQVLEPFVAPDIEVATLRALCHEAYGPEVFRHPAVCPLVQLGPNEWLLELFHGPTLAFKDIALQLVGRLFDHVLGRRGDRVTIVGATSGDTGSAAIDALKGLAHVDCVILYPAGRVSEVQRRQMTTVEAPNVHAVAVEGTFDDCQDLVKAMFNDGPFRDELRLGAVNSINWARVMAQAVYYVWSAGALGGGVGGRPIAYCVPTGNFGNVLAGWVANRMGLPVAQLLVASNTNDILTRWLRTGVMSVGAVTPTLSPSMDIQVSSNVERLLFELNGRDGGVTEEQLHRFRATGSLSLEPDQMHEVLRLFSGARADDTETLAVIERTWRQTGQLVDPHTAVGLAATGQRRDHRVPLVTLATAHPAKFPDAVERAVGLRPPLPPHLADLMTRPERTATVANDLGEVERLVRRLVAR